MPAAIPAIIGAAGSIGSSLIGSNAAGKAADAQLAAANSTNQTTLQMYNQNRADQTPWRTAGGQAVNALSQWYGLGGVQSAPGPTANSYGGIDLSKYGYGSGFGFSGYPAWMGNAAANVGATANAQNQVPDFQNILQNLPGYQFQFDQGQQAVQRSLAARGLLSSGAAGKALTQYGQGLAQDYAGQYVNGLQSLAGVGQTSVGNTGAAGMNAAGQIGSANAYAGNAQATGYMNQANSWQQGLSGLTSSLGSLFGPSSSGYQVPSDISSMINTPIGGPSSASSWFNSLGG